MALSVRVFGLNTWSVLVPQALEGVAAVGVLYAAVRRWFGPAAGLIAGAVLALTPVAVLMFRFNNPDALLVLLLARPPTPWSGHWRPARTRWLVLVGALVGFGFLTKMLQAFLVVPVFALVYLVAAPARLRPADRAAAGRPGGPGRGGRLVGGHRASSSRPRTGPTSAARRTTASSNSPWATTDSAG